MITSLYDDQIPTETDSETGLPIGPVVTASNPARTPDRITLEGRYCRLEPIEAKRHAGQLLEASNGKDANTLFRYLPDSPPASMADMVNWIDAASASSDPLFFAVIDKRTDRVEGRQSLLRITPEHQSIEIGHIYWGPGIAKSVVATEANFLFARYAFELGFRRYEWKCDALNAPSRNAALRFGFTFEGHFRRAVITKGRSRDTAWYGMIDEDWESLKPAYEAWLDPSNFDANGQQLRALGEFTVARSS